MNVAKPPAGYCTAGLITYNLHLGHLADAFVQSDLQ